MQRLPDVAEWATAVGGPQDRQETPEEHTTSAPPFRMWSWGMGQSLSTGCWCDREAWARVTLARPTRPIEAAKRTPTPLD